MSMMEQDPEQTYDVLIVGGGVNGAGIAADAAGRGLSVLLCEKDDLASATSSSSSKLIHGGIRYLEHYEFRLVAKALAEREVLLRAAPHIIWPLRFRLPHLPSLRPAWMIRIGLFLYDHLARRASLPGSRSVRFGPDSPLKPGIQKGFEYSDCWVDDARLVVLNAMAARDHGALILPRTRCVSAQYEGAVWQVLLHNEFSGEQQRVKARLLVNAAGPWVQSFIEEKLHRPSPRHVRLVKGSHIVVPRLYEGPECYILQNDDKRIVFAIPYEGEFTLIGTTDKEISGDPGKVEIDADEQAYLLSIINHYFKRQITDRDICWSYAGVRPLLDDESSDASTVTRDYLLTLTGMAEGGEDGARAEGGAPLLSVFGGKITTFRLLAKEAVDKMQAVFPDLGPSRTQEQTLPGGDFDNPATLYDRLKAEAPWLPDDVARRYVRSYGTAVFALLDGCTSLAAMGEDFGAGLYEAEVQYLRRHEWAVQAEDIVWRRSKRGLFMTKAQQSRLQEWLNSRND
ncbi:glycerol-3-phosphate dehydrogenase [Iodidimonas nitroreducens]|uniref:Glycerol-3-phosphate dehydrogenase n=1 Tax=Iodidimonas nitroreducens TaxID=1236968 RepID=A0A5A7N856_9PROT|nr:glycerol-3-phosphate dehydrogenase [Iodidimonas nitroreducens]GAK33165.1 glycerol-3-phosphate dehydrogenase [alpha proteobacterium Q-1]GER04268.1 glycerol-3-phosphate dehydrogenase [Iodidimonas nitroreducens]